MYVTLNTKPIHIKEYAVNALIYSLLIASTTFALPFLPYSEVLKNHSVSDMWGGYFLFSSGSFFLLIWVFLKHQVEQCLAFDGDWQKERKPFFSFGFTGVFVGLFVPYVMTFAIGIIFASFALNGIIPFRKQKFLNTHEISEWSDHELLVAQKTISNMKNKILINAIKRECQLRNL